MISKLMHFAVLLVLIQWACKTNTTTQTEQTNWTIGPFEKLDHVNPVLIPDSTKMFFCPVRSDSVYWEEKDVFNPATVVKDDTLFMIYRAEDVVGKYNGTSRLGLAYSMDGIHFEKFPDPVLYPENDEFRQFEWEGGIEDPRIVESPDHRYIMTYTAYDGETARLCLATSGDLRNWQKYGPVLRDEWIDFWSKSGSIVCKLENGQFVAQKINGIYWMYFGDTDIYAAYSDDLLHWSPVLSDSSELQKIFSPRAEYFDSDLVEPGPPALLTSAGILLIYNSRNYGPSQTPDLPEGTYTAGQILFDKTDPLTVIHRTDEYFMRPDQDYEIHGQVNQVVFLEGLSLYKEFWWLYYGTADSKIAVARSPYDNALFFPSD